MSSQPLANDPQVQEELSAYLDGELDADARAQIELRLARDADYRAEFQRLAQAWDLLDRLPRATVDESFSRSTLEMVAVAAAEDVLTAVDLAPRRARWLWVGGIAGLVACALAGLGAGRLLWPDPNAELVRDLPLLEHFELYQHADSVEFLRELDKSRLFPAEESHDG